MGTALSFSGLPGPVVVADGSLAAPELPHPGPRLDELPTQRVAGRPQHAPQHDLAVVVPAYNEALRLQPTLDALSALLDQVSWSVEVVVVDNGSVDRTAQLVTSHDDDRFRVIGCSRRGKGAAVRRGFAAADARRVGFMDADLATPVEYLLPAMDLLDGGADAVIASRTARGATEEGKSALRQVASSVFRRSRPTLVSDFVDTQCGFKFFDAQVAARAFSRVRTEGFAFDVELLAHVVAQGGVVAELPVRWTDVDGSTFSPLRHGLASLAEMNRIRRSLVGVGA